MKPPGNTLTVPANSYVQSVVFTSNAPITIPSGFTFIWLVQTVFKFFGATDASKEEPRISCTVSWTDAAVSSGKLTLKSTNNVYNHSASAITIDRYDTKYVVFYKK